MEGTLVARKRNIQSKPKVKTGCGTCRKRRIKCDENKPFCRRCVDTGRTCDGYESPFRLAFTRQPTNTAHAGGNHTISVGSQLIQPSLTDIKIAPRDIELLGRYFSTKTLFDVKLGCNEEAKHILQASLSEPPIRHAVSSLKALREHLETSGDVASSVAQQTPSYGYEYGLQQYCVALGGLASMLSYPESSRPKSALLCCQIFISIEQVRGNYVAMAQHMVQGLSIMHQHRARPKFVTANTLVPANPDRIPLLDVFIIKLFAAPCKFADPPATIETSGTTVAVCPHQQHVKNRKIAPDLRAGLTRIAETTLDFLGKVSRVKSTADALQLLPEKAALLVSSEAWLSDLERVLTETRSPQTEPLSVSFLRIFHQILKMIVLGALYSSPDHFIQLRTETDQLRHIASNVEEGVKVYRAQSGVRRDRRELSRVC